MVHKQLLAPHAIREMSEEDKKLFAYNGMPHHICTRMQFKLCLILNLWSKLRQSQDIQDLLMAVPSEEKTDEYKAKMTIVNILDFLGKALSTTDIEEEFAYEGEEERDDKQKK